jgi:hypothetical protein
VLHHRITGPQRGHAPGSLRSSRLSVCRQLLNGNGSTGESSGAEVFIRSLRWRSCPEHKTRQWRRNPDGDVAGIVVGSPRPDSLRRCRPASAQRRPGNRTTLAPRPGHCVPTAMTASSNSHFSLLERRAALAGQVWAREMRESLRKQLRRAAGGWPGTITEARARLAEFVLPRLTREAAAAVTSSDREQAARTLYASARSTWLAQCDREEGV